MCCHAGSLSASSAIVQVYLDEHETNGVQFLTDMIEKYCSAATPDNADSASGQPAYDSEPVEPAWKKAKLEMLAKHSSVRSSNDRELQQYRCISTMPTDDVLSWWKKQTETFPKLALLAKGVLAVPATSAPSERIFSIAGLVVQAKRSSFVPENVSKILFMHSNGHLIVRD